MRVEYGTKLLPSPCIQERITDDTIGVWSDCVSGPFVITVRSNEETGTVLHSQSTLLRVRNFLR
jgi:hypothetical protein